MTEIILPANGWLPRDYQLPAMQAMQGGKRRACLVWHRRAGKDSFSLNFTAIQTQLRVGTYIHFLPLATGARRVVWNGVDRLGRRMIDQAFPKEMRTNTRDNDMMIEFKNGSFWYCAGSDYYEALMGTNPVGVVFSEYAIGDPMAWEYIRPILAENGGWAVFLYTPRGENHGYDLYEMARTNPNWFCELLPLSVTGAYPLSVVDDEIAEGMDPDLARQEFHCSFQAPRMGAFFGSEMEAAELQKRIVSVPYETQLVVHTAWDLGVHDDTAIILFQLVGGEIRVVDFIHDRGKGFSFYVDLLKKRKELYRFTWGDFCLPHDIVVQEMGSGVTRLRTLKNLMDGQGVANWKTGVQMKYPDTLVPIRQVLPRCYFDPVKAQHLIRSLKNYRREYDEKKHMYKDKPLHDWSCFDGSTLVWTRKGYCAIQDLPETGEVVTLCGWKAYENPRITRRDAPLVEVAFDDGTTVFCTAEHRFLTESGWSIAANLRSGMRIQSTLTRSRIISMAAFIAFGKARDTFQKAGYGSIEMFGRLYLALYPKGIMSTTGMETSLIMPFQISNVLRLRNIYPQFDTTEPHLRQRETLPLRGTALKRAGFGTGGRLNDQRVGLSGRGLSGLASGAVRLFQWLTARTIRSVFAPTSVKVSSVTQTGKRADVWCLTVPEVGHFSLPNGAVVANSHGVDCFRELAIYCSRGTRSKAKDQRLIDKYRKEALQGR